MRGDNEVSFWFWSRLKVVFLDSVNQDNFPVTCFMAHQWSLYRQCFILFTAEKLHIAFMHYTFLYWTCCSIWFIWVSHWHFFFCRIETEEVLSDAWTNSFETTLETTCWAGKWTKLCSCIAIDSGWIWCVFLSPTNRALNRMKKNSIMCNNMEKANQMRKYIKSLRLVK